MKDLSLSADDVYKFYVKFYAIHNENANGCFIPNERAMLLNRFWHKKTLSFIVRFKRYTHRKYHHHNVNITKKDDSYKVNFESLP